MIFLPEIVVEGKRLGRHIEHDLRSLLFLASDGVETSIEWERHIPILDQGDLGSCTGNALTGALGSGPLYDALIADVTPVPVLDEAFAVSVYSAAEKLDGGAGYPPEDNGSSGLSVAKVAKTDGYASGYLHATTVAQAHGALNDGPVMFGTDWLTGMDSPSSEGIVQVTGTSRGGHEYVCRQYDAARDLWWMDNSWAITWGLQGRFAYDTPSLTKLLSRGGDVTALVPLSEEPPTPTPAPETALQTFLATPGLAAWAAAHHVSENEIVAKATEALLAASS